MKAYLLVFLGAGIGGALRHGVNVGCARMCGTAFPWGTLTVNVVGSFVMGALAGWLAFKAGEGWSQPLRLFLTTGILGGFTTFSAFSLDAVLIWERGQAGIAATYVIASLILSIAGLAVGLGLIRAVSG
ncbi:fluoride efflux transporter CrcB [Microvirga terrae]|uniref:Fluoride-specific ion channel FluC n=1 Tax=Microvirga terrae TaxID=2740529 RepID=A0ABY5RZA0_9HYPH|nr:MULTISPECIES: fluoride efflux transporter CrcB [Microvirga]MBQ0820382.1 fluoride efflux transporter CrcB [Microvirga sp. HBU67558]UVF21309.1 fluoride efflux transporter CrcB [Microvirga terrae]